MNSRIKQEQCSIKKNQSELIACNMDSICKMKIENSRHEANMQCSDKTKKNRKKNNRSWMNCSNAITKNHCQIRNGTALNVLFPFKYLSLHPHYSPRICTWTWCIYQVDCKRVSRVYSWWNEQVASLNRKKEKGTRILFN